MAAGAASLVGTLSGNKQLANIGGQLAAGTDGNVQNNEVAALQARASTQGCKLPIEAQVSPEVSKMNCKSLQAEWVSATNAPVSAPVSAGVVAKTGAQDKIAMVGAAASLAGALTGNQGLAKVGEISGQVTGNGQAQTGTGVDNERFREELQIAAQARKCKLPGASSSANGQQMSCVAIMQELKSLPVGTPVLATPDNKLAQGAQAVGMLASVAGALSGNESMKAVGQQASALSAGNGSDVSSRRASLEAQAKAQKCKL